MPPSTPVSPSRWSFTGVICALTSAFWSAAFSAVMAATGADPDSAGGLLADTRRFAAPLDNPALDAVVAYGTTDAIAARLKEHLDAGADHVAVQVLTSPDKLVPALAELAGPLGLQ